MAFDFPASPSVGQLYPSPALQNASQYYWDGAKWIVWAGPVPTKNVVFTDGSAPMTGQLTLLATPVASTDAASKAYVDAQIASGVPSGTVMLFWQAAAPVGWTKLTTQNDKALRVVSGSGGVAGGTISFSTLFAAGTVTGSHTLTAAEIPGISSSGANTITVYPGGSSSVHIPGTTSGINTWAGAASTGFWTPATGDSSSWGQYSAFSGSNTIAVTSTNTGGGGHTHPMNLAVQYLDLILCSKN